MADLPSDTPSTQPTPGGPPVPAPRLGGRVGMAACLVLLAALVALVVVTGAGRVADDPPALLIAAVTFLPYLYAALGACAFATWCVLPDRRLPPGVLAGTAAVASLVWGPSWPARGHRAAGEGIRVMEWNVQRLWGLGDDVARGLDCVVDAVEASEPDTLVLLEVSGADVGKLVDRLSLRCAHTDYLGTGDTGVGGLAVCTRGDRWRLVEGGGQPYVDEDDWRYVFAEVERDGHVVNVLAVHLYPYRFGELVRRLLRGDPRSLDDLRRAGEAVTRAQGAHTAALQRRVERFRDPTIMAGDFNSTRDAALHTTLRRRLTDAWERGGKGMGTTIRVADAVPLRVDYVYVTPQLAVEGSEVLDVDCSDHRPVLTRLSLIAGSGVR